MSVRLRFPLKIVIPKIEIPKVEEDIVCWKLKWVKPEPPGMVNVIWDFTGHAFYVDNSGNVTFGDYSSDWSVFYVYTYDVNGNMVRVFSTTDTIWGPNIYESTWGQNVSVSTVTAGSYMVIADGSKIYVFRYGKKIWEWDLSYDGIQNKRFFLLAISPSGKYIASTIGKIGGLIDDSIVLYEGCSDASLCPKPP